MLPRGAPSRRSSAPQDGLRAEDHDIRFVEVGTALFRDDGAAPTARTHPAAGFSPAASVAPSVRFRFMVGTLPANLLFEARTLVDSVVRLNLPADVWLTIESSLHRIDDAVQADDEQTLRSALRTLRGVQYMPLPGSSYPTAFPGAGSPPAGPGSLPSGSRLLLVIGWFGAFVAFFAIGLVTLFIATGGSGGEVDEAPPPGVPEPGGEVPESGGSGGIAIAIGLAMAACIAVIAVALLQWRRARSSSPPVAAGGEDGRHLPAPSPIALPAPHEIREYANRTVRTLAAYGGQS